MTVKTTITEALAEIKIITKKIDSKAAFINEHVYRQEAYKDPLVKDGGAAVVIANERQSINDLAARAVLIRRKIADANAANAIEIGGETKSIADWLVWRRDVAPGILVKMRQWANTAATARRQAQQKGMSVVKSSDETTSINDVVINLDELALSNDIQQVETALGTLDGRLSLFNATTYIEL